VADRSTSYIKASAGEGTVYELTRSPLFFCCGLRSNTRMVNKIRSVWRLSSHFVCHNDFPAYIYGKQPTGYRRSSGAFASERSACGRCRSRAVVDSSLDGWGHRYRLRAEGWQTHGAVRECRLPWRSVATRGSNRRWRLKLECILGYCIKPCFIA